jgi:hypothetical protein
MPTPTGAPRHAHRRASPSLGRWPRRSHVALSIAALVLLGAEATAWADLTYYALAPNGQFGTLDVHTGAFTTIGTLNDFDTGDFARLPGGTLYGVEDNQDFVTIDPVKLTTTPIGNTGNGILVIKFRKDGTLFGASYTDLYTVDPTTAQATHIGKMGSFAAGFYDLSFDDNNNLFLVQGMPSDLYSVDSTTGLATKIGATGFQVAAADYQIGTFYGFTTSGEIITIDTTTGAGKSLIAAQTAVSAVAVAGSGAADGGMPGADGGGKSDAGGTLDAGSTDGGLLPPAEGGVVDAGGLAVDAGGPDGSDQDTGHSGSGGCGCHVGAPARPGMPFFSILSLVGVLGLLRYGRRRRPSTSMVPSTGGASTLTGRS